MNDQMTAKFREFDALLEVGDGAGAGVMLRAAIEAGDADFIIYARAALSIRARAV